VTEQEQEQESGAHEDEDDGTPDMSLTSEILGLQHKVKQLNVQLDELKATVYYLQ